MRVAHVLGNLNYGGPQLRILTIIERLPQFEHAVIYQSYDDGPLKSAYAKAADLRQLPRKKDKPVRTFIRLVRMLREIAPDAILAHQFGNHTLVAWAAFFSGVPVTFGVSTTDPVHYSRSRWKPLLLAQLGRPVCTGEIAVSETVGEVLASDLYLPRRRITVIRNGCPVEGVAARAEKGRAAAREERRGALPRLVMAAIISRTKDHATVIHAVDALRKRGRPVELLVAGHALRAEGMAAVRALIEKLALADHVKLLGPRADVPELMGASDIFVHATESEGTSVAVLEAMAAGIPVVATDIPALREELDGGRCGALVPAHDPSAVADAIESLLDDERLRAKLVSAASEWVRSRYDVSIMAARYSDLLVSATSG